MQELNHFQFGSVFTITLYSSFSHKGIFETLYQFYGSPYLIAGRKAATPAGPSSTAGGGVWINQDIDNRSSYPFKVLVDLHFSKLVRDLQCWQSEEADPTPLTHWSDQKFYPM